MSGLLQKRHLFLQCNQHLGITIAFTWLPRSWLQAVLRSQIRYSEDICNRKLRLQWSQDYSEQLSYNLWLESSSAAGRPHALAPASVWELSIAEARENFWKSWQSGGFVLFSVLFGISSNCQESCGFVFMRDFVFIMPLNAGQQVKVVFAMCWEVNVSGSSASFP